MVDSIRDQLLEVFDGKDTHVHIVIDECDEYQILVKGRRLCNHYSFFDEVIKDAIILHDMTEVKKP